MKNFQLLVLFLFSFVGTALAGSNVANTSIAEFSKGKESQQGFFSFLYDQQNGKVYLKIDQTKKQFLFQSSLPHGVGSNDIGLDRGQLGDTRLVQFERVGSKIFLRQLNTYYRANSKNSLERQAIEEAFASSIIWGFKVVASDKDSNSVVIDYTPFLLSDIHNVADKLKKRKQGSFKIDTSRSGVYQQRTKAFPENTELEATVTFTGKGTGEFIKSVMPDANALTVNLHHSLIKLPDDNYQTREFHPFSGFWSIEHADYASAIDESLIKRVIPRHRLKKKNPEAAVSEAIEPIIYYLDAGVPEPVRSALIEGASWWNQAFEAIGYKNAFQVKILPENVDPMDARYNVIQWVHRATRGWSYGSSIIDPRTGEIIKGHVTLGSLRVRQDYLIALGLTSPFKTENTDTSKMLNMALARIRQLSAHEVGHTLGISHNFSASVNNRSSVMDYPHPNILLNNDKIDLSDAYARDIGIWDKYVVAYGYSDVPREQENDTLDKLVRKAQSDGLLYISDQDARPKSGGNATAHLWDNGQNPADELSRVLKVRKKALSDFGINSIPYGTPLSEIEQVLVPIYNFHRFQVEAAAKLIAGIDYSYEVRDDAVVDSYQVVDGKIQRQALDVLLETLSTDVLTLPESIIKLIPPKAYGFYRNRESFPANTGLTFDPVTAAEASVKHTVSLLLNPQRLARLQQQSVMHKNIISISALLDKLLKTTVKQNAKKGLALLVQQRVNQQVVEHLLTLWHSKGLVSEVRSEVFVALKALNIWIKKNSNGHKYQGLKAQYALFNQQITHSLSNAEMYTPASKVKLPPGSPIGSSY